MWSLDAGAMSLKKFLEKKQIERTKNNPKKVARSTQKYIKSVPKCSDTTKKYNKISCTDSVPKTRT